jgi:hypothetical protein
MSHGISDSDIAILNILALEYNFAPSVWMHANHCSDSRLEVISLERTPSKFFNISIEHYNICYAFSAKRLVH